MCMTDPVSDMLSRLRNALSVRKSQVFVPYSRLKESILELLFREGYIKSVSTMLVDGIKMLIVDLKYYSGAPVIAKVKKISKPGCRVYSSYKELKPVNCGLGIVVLSTSAGVISDYEARDRRLGGEVLLEVF